MKIWLPVLLLTAIGAGFAAGYATSAGIVHAQPAAPNPATKAAPAQPSLVNAPGEWSKMSIAPDAGAVVHWSSDDIQKLHRELVARSNRGEKGFDRLAMQSDLLPVFISRTHSVGHVHRPHLGGESERSEAHDGVTDFLVIIAGGGTLSTGGTMPNRRSSKPGEYGGGPIMGGKQYRLQPGDLLNVPPGVPHALTPDPSGITYAVMKINTGLYPWSLINGAP